MELVTGQDFSQMLERDGHIDERLVLRMALDVADGLSALNREGLVHGDIKPGNIVLDRDGNAKLVDFGLSGMTRHDSSGALVGTPNYIAPELLRCAADTHRSDLYSLGATLYHLLSGRPPFEGETPNDVLKARLLHRPAPLGKHAPHISLATQKLIMRMLDADPEKRQVNSDAVATDLRNALARLESPTRETPAAAGFSNRLFARFNRPRGPQPSASILRSQLFVPVSLCLIAVLLFLIALEEHAFQQTWQWLRGDVAGPIKALVLAPSKPSPVTFVPAEQVPETKPPEAPPMLPPQPPPVTAAPVNKAPETKPPEAPPALPPLTPPAAVASVVDLFTTEAKLIWKSINLGEENTSGSTITMKKGETMVIQGTGTDMWKGYDRCRLVWTKASGNYAFSAQVKAIANIHNLAITGLLVKGKDPAVGPGLLFGFLGSGELFLQIRQPNNQTVVVKRSDRPVRLPTYLQVTRRGKAFEACVSADGLAWDTFASCELDLPADNAIGFAVSAQEPNILATAKIANIRLLMPGPPLAAKTNSVPAVTAKPAPAARKK